MDIHPDIAALRSDPAVQRRAQEPMCAAVEAWRKSPHVLALTRDLARYDAGAGLEECAQLTAFLGNHKSALNFVRTWCDHLMEALRHAPLAEVMFRHRQSNGFSTIQLLRVGRATLSLCAYERQNAIREPDIARFIDIETCEVVLSGCARGTMHRLEERNGVPSVETRPMRWRGGDRISMVPGSARQIVAVAGSLLIAQVSRSAAEPGPSREYRLADNCLIKSATGDKRASSDLMALGVLGALEHRPALAAMEQITPDPSRDPDLRWEAVRQALSLDPARGLSLLDRLIECRDARLSVPAASLRSQLLTTYPQLKQIEREAA